MEILNSFELAFRQFSTEISEDLKYLELDHLEFCTPNSVGRILWKDIQFQLEIEKTFYTLFTGK